MKQRLHSAFGFLKTTAIGGVLLLLPILVVAGALGYVYHFVALLHQEVKQFLPFNSATGFFLLFTAAVLVLLGICFVAGLAARRAIGVQFAEKIEKQIIKVIPKYGIYKDILAGQFGGSANMPSLRPVLVKREGVMNLGLQADELSNGLVVVYLPGAPDPWNGIVALVAAEQVRPLDLPFTEMVGLCERLGRDAAPHLNSRVTKE